MSQMIQLNLLPDIKKNALKAQQTKSYVISIAIIATIIEVGISVLLFVYVTYVQQLQVNLLDGDIKEKTAELQDVPDINKYLTIQNQLQALPELHNQKGAFSRLMTFLPVLNPNAPNNVTLTDLQVNTTDQSMLLTGTADSFQAMNVFVDTLDNARVSLKDPAGDVKEQDMFKSVSVQSGGLGRVENKEVVTFLIQVAYNPAAFDAQNSDVQAVIPNIKTSQSVTNSPDSQLFNKQEGQ